MAADLRCGGLLYHDREVAGRGDARPAFRRARTICAQSRDRIGQKLAGAASAYRARLSSNAGRQKSAEACLEPFSAQKTRLPHSWRHAFANDCPAKRTKDVKE